ncbi:MAG: hypothetical protein V7641_1253 [Blastocatellia bacterium]
MADSLIWSAVTGHRFLLAMRKSCDQSQHSKCCRTPFLMPFYLDIESFHSVRTMAAGSSKASSAARTASTADASFDSIVSFTRYSSLVKLG